MSRLRLVTAFSLASGVPAAPLDDSAVSQRSKAGPGHSRGQVNDQSQPWRQDAGISE
ncbi:MAG: hypothetical protein JWP26_2940 [Devosia sp.]|nr:hypothetical protein [Devosia sp.]